MARTLLTIAGLAHHQAAGARRVRPVGARHDACLVRGYALACHLARNLAYALASQAAALLHEHAKGHARFRPCQNIASVAAPRPLPPVTPDGRYLVVRGRLWRRANPDLPDAQRQALVQELMQARRGVATAKRQQDAKAEAAAHRAADKAKQALGERGPVWWQDGAPDYTRHLAKNTPYAAWYAAQGAGR